MRRFLLAFYHNDETGKQATNLVQHKNKMASKKIELIREKIQLTFGKNF